MVATQAARQFLKVGDGYRVESGGNVTRRHDSKLFRIRIGRPFAGAPIKLYVADQDIRIVTEDGKLLRELTLDTSRVYQPRWK